MLRASCRTLLLHPQVKTTPADQQATAYATNYAGYQQAVAGNRILPAWTFQSARKGGRAVDLGRVHAAKLSAVHCNSPLDLVIRVVLINLQHYTQPPRRRLLPNQHLFIDGPNRPSSIAEASARYVPGNRINKKCLSMAGMRFSVEKLAVGIEMGENNLTKTSRSMTRNQHAV